ncbi:MAG: ribokinase [Gaiellales bacterium]|nr:ribokinase [Gaiellales bacterium]
MRAPRIVVVGSCNMDIAAFVERAPERGETVSGIGSKTGPGGKGANQAIAAARLGASVGFVGAVGDDPYGESLRAAFTSAGVDVSQLRTVDEETGTAHIVVEATGANRIVVVPGANGTLTCLMDEDRRLIAGCDLLLLQLESPLEVVIESAAAARAAGTRVVLTPAPARALPEELTNSLDILVPNEHEALQVAAAGDLETAIAILVERVPHVVVTLGERGGVHVGRDGARTVFAPPRVEAVDTTAAGDPFVGALALALGQDRDWPEALSRAAAAAAVSVGRPGASESMPRPDEVERLLVRAGMSAGAPRSTAR